MGRRIPRRLREAQARDKGQTAGRGPWTPIILTALGAATAGGAAGARLNAKLHSRDIASQINAANIHVSAVEVQKEYPSVETVQEAYRALGKLEALGGVLSPRSLARDLHRRWQTAFQRAQRVAADHKRGFLEQLAKAPQVREELRQQVREQLRRPQLRPRRQPRH